MRCLRRSPLLSTPPFAALLVVVAATTTPAVPLTAEQKNAAMLLESAHLDLTALPAFSDDAPEQTLDVAGTFSATGWAWSIVGMFNGLPLALSYVGSFDAALDTATWTGTGTYGTEPWNASGSAQFGVSDISIMGFGSIGPGQRDDWGYGGVVGVEIELGGRTRLFGDFGFTYTRRGRLPIAVGAENRLVFEPSTGAWGKDLFLRGGTSVPPVPWRFESEGTLGPPTTGRITLKPIPEPSTLLLLGVAMGGLTGVRRIRIARRSDSLERQTERQSIALSCG